MFRLTFLGTSSGVPTRTRNVSAIAVECIKKPNVKRNDWLLVDCGEGTQHQILNSHLALNNLSAILITHMHGDHCYGLGGLLASLNMKNRTKPLTIIAPKAIIKLLDTLSIVSDLYFNYPIDFMIIENNIEKEILLKLDNNHNIKIRICELSHRIASFGFEIIQELQTCKLLTRKLSNDNIDSIYWNAIIKLDELIITDNSSITPKDYKNCIIAKTKIVIAGDNDTPSLLANAVLGCQALVHEATYTDDVMQKIINKPTEQGGFDPKHSSAKIVAQFAQQHAIPMLILTHFSARYVAVDDEFSKQLNMGHLRSEAQQYYDGKLILAKDFLQVLVA